MRSVSAISLLFDTLHSAWQPVKVGDVEAQVRAPFYGLVFMADFIGTSPDVQIAPVNITEGDAVHLVAYAAYENRHLAKVALIKWVFSMTMTC